MQNNGKISAYCRIKLHNPQMIFFHF